MKLVNKLFNKYPKALTIYVALGLTVVDKTIAPLNKLMVHLLSIQGIDPSTSPGEKQEQAFRQALIDSMNKIEDAVDFDEDFKFPILRGLKRVNDKLKDLQITRSGYEKMTDLSKLSDTPKEVNVNPVKITADPPVLKTIDIDPLQNLKTYLQGTVDTPKVVDDSEEIKKNIEELKNFIEKYKPELLTSPEVMTVPRAPVAVGNVPKAKKRSHSKKIPLVDATKGCFRRS